MKTCTKCKKQKSAEFFCRTPNGNLRGACKSCMSQAQLERTARQKSEDINLWVFNRRYAVLKYKYGITREEYNEMLQKQNEVCAICFRPNRSQTTSNTPEISTWLAVDHCHKTGTVRGLLCTPCNSALGLLEDNPDIIYNAFLYLSQKGDRNGSTSNV